MISIKEIKEAIEETNLGPSFFHLAPKAFYDKEETKIEYLSNPDYYEYYKLMNENFDASESRVSKILGNSSRYIPIVVFIDNNDIALTYSELYKDKELGEAIEHGFKEFKSMLINKGLLEDFFDFRDKFILTRAIIFCNENNIDYN